jgi:hypothetical protein
MNSMDEPYYMRLADDPTFWLVQGGVRKQLNTIDEFWANEQPVIVVEQDELDAVPIKRKRRVKSKAKE